MIVFYNKKALVVKRNPLTDSNTMHHMEDEDDTWRLFTLHPSHPLCGCGKNEGDEIIFLGLSKENDEPYFAMELKTPPPAPLLRRQQQGEGEGTGSPFFDVITTTHGNGNGNDTVDTVYAIDVRSQGQKMSGHDAAVLAYASGLLQWHSSALFCTKTGNVLVSTSGGHARNTQTNPSTTSTTSTNGEKKIRAVYPRIDPAVIVAVTHGPQDEWFLLGRKKTWDQGRYSLLAGFTEVGETLEQAAVREVFEESGVQVGLGSLKYHSSQPWPFPQSLMIGFVGRTATSASTSTSNGYDWFGGSIQGRQAAMEQGITPREVALSGVGGLPPTITVDQNEMEDVRWFHKEWLTRQLSIMGGTDEPAFRIPGPYALAHRIITDSLDSVRQQHSSSTHSGGVLDSIPDVQIDEGTFKYVLMRVSCDSGGDGDENENGALHAKLVVRGDRRAAYHNHIYTHFKSTLDPSLQVDVVGGGRMEHHQDHRVAAVYGYSAAYGAAPHEMTAALLMKWNPFLDVSVSYEGY